MQFDVKQIKQVVIALADVWKAIEGDGWVSGSRVAETYSGDVVLPHGWQVRAGGNFSVVIFNDAHPDVVVKFSPRQEDAYFHYALLCRANPNPHAPNILHIEKIGDDGYFVVLPKYTQYRDPVLDKRRHWGDIANIREYVSTIIHSPHDPLPNVCVAKFPRTLGKFAKMLGMYFEGVGGIDLHDDNVMWDGDTLIITDPVSYSYRSDRNEHKFRALEATLKQDPIWTQGEAPQPQAA